MYVGLEAAESTADTVPGCSEAFRAAASEPGIVNLPSAAVLAATVLLQPATAGDGLPPLDLEEPQALQVVAVVLEVLLWVEVEEVHFFLVLMVVEVRCPWVGLSQVHHYLSVSVWLFLASTSANSLDAFYTKVAAAPAKVGMSRLLSWRSP